MRIGFSLILALFSVSFSAAEPADAGGYYCGSHGRYASKISPKVFIISMFEPEAAVWWGIDEFDILANNISVTGFSPLFPDAHCTNDGDICQIIVGEGEINAASSIMALMLSDMFNLTKTYFIIAGIAGINPQVATVCSVTFARYAVQVALQYEFDAREMPDNFTTGYIPLGANSPDEYPVNIYGTEVFEVSAVLQEMAIGFASAARLNDSETAIEYRAQYAESANYSVAALPPTVIGCDVATSDVYFSGALLSEAFGNFSQLVTNGTANYCTTAQEDNATLEAMVRAAQKDLIDFSRIVIMRTASDFDRPPPNVSPLENLRFIGAFRPALANIYLAGIKVVEGILNSWNRTFEKGIEPTNYVGDIFATFGGTSDFGPSDLQGDDSLKKRGLEQRIKRRVLG